MSTWPITGASVRSSGVTTSVAAAVAGFLLKLQFGTPFSSAGPAQVSAAPGAGPGKSRRPTAAAPGALRRLNAGCLEQRRSVLGAGAHQVTSLHCRRTTGDQDQLIRSSPILISRPNATPAPFFHLAPETARPDIDHERRDGRDDQDEDHAHVIAAIRATRRHGPIWCADFCHVLWKRGGQARSSTYRFDGGLVADPACATVAARTAVSVLVARLDRNSRWAHAARRSWVRPW